MPRERIDADQAFFTERKSMRASGRRRSLRRARALALHLGIDLNTWQAHPERVVTVVGSKGKGTAAIFASATLAAAGLRVGTLTSPGLRSNRERIRVDGESISHHEYVALVSGVTQTLERVSASLPEDGYLSPSGLFTLSGLRHFAERGCDAVVLEAGMGGASDEVSLVTPGVVVITAVLAEHVGVLGESVAAIAAEKAGVITSATRDVVTAEQGDPGAAGAIAAAATAHACRSHRADAALAVGAPGLGEANARLGVTAARLLLDLAGRSAPPAAALDAALQSVRIPGRLSRHRRGDQEWIVDCATNPAAIAAAIGHTTSAMGPPTAVLTFLPRHRDTRPLRDALRGLPVVEVPSGRLGGATGPGAAIRMEAIDLDALGSRVLAVGPVYFAGEVLALLDVDCDRIFRAPGRETPGR